MKNTYKKVAVALILAALFVIQVSAATLTDIEGHWAEKNILRLVDRNIINGYKEDNTFRPENEIIILEYIAMVERSIGEAPETWGQPYIDKAEDLGLIKKNEFKDVYRNIMREEMAYIIINALERGKGDIEIDQQLKSQVNDYNTIKDEYADSVLKAYKIGLITGYEDGDFRPGNTATRAEAATVIIRLLSKLEEPEQPQEPGVHPLTEELKNIKKSDLMDQFGNSLAKYFDIIDGKVQLISYWQKSSLNYHDPRFIDDSLIPNINEMMYAFMKNSDSDRFQMVELIQRTDDNENVILLTYCYNRVFFNSRKYYFRFNLRENYTYNAKADWLLNHFSDKVNMTLKVRRVNEVDGSTEGQVEKDIADRLIKTIKDMFPDQGQDIADYVMNKVLVYQEKPETEVFKGIQVDYIEDGGLNFFFTFLND